MEEDKIEKYFFHDLIDFRRQKGISKNDIVKKTKINIKYIDFIESGNLKEIPKIYIKLFLKSYAKSIGYDEKEILSSYNDYVYKLKNKITDSRIPKYIKNKNSIKTENKTVQNQIYLIDVKKIIFFIFSVSFVILCWLIFASILNNQEESYVHQKLEWKNDFKNLNIFEIEYIENKNIKKNNEIKISPIKGYSRFIIIDDNDKIEATKIIKKDEEYKNNFEGKIEIGFENYNELILNINNQTINLKNNIGKKILILDPNNLKPITIKHIQ